MSTPLTVPLLLTRNAALHAGRDAIVTPEGSITHDRLDVVSRTAARRLLAAGVGHGTRVGLLAENGVDWVVVAAAVMRIGAVVVPLSTVQRPPELEAQLRVASVEVLVSTRRFRGRELLDEASSVAGRVAGLRKVIALEEAAGSGPTGGTFLERRISELERSVQPDDDLVVLFTSGSRGLPKGVLHTHGSSVRAVSAGLDARCIGTDDRLYLPMPLFWTGGFSVGLATMLVAGNALLTEAKPETAGTLRFLDRERATLFRGWPDQAASLAAHPDRAKVDLSELRGASLPALLPNATRPVPGARPNLLGMTESFGPYCGERLDVDLPPDLRGCCGRPFPGIEVRVVDPQTGVEPIAGSPGEIWLRGPSILKGICGRSRSDVFTEHGWFRTGDLGRQGPEGHIWFDGRLDDMFKVNGASVYPSEVESALRRLEGVREAHVVDVPDERGARVGALVVSSRSGDEIRNDLRERLSPFKIPTCWLVTQDAQTVPRGATGKVDATALRALLADQARSGVG